MEAATTKGHEGPRSADADLLLKEEVCAIVGAAIEVHRVLGSGFLESVYAEAFAIELRERNIPFQAQIPIGIHYKQHRLQKRFVCDLIIHGQIVIELKAIPSIGKTETAQTLNYLRATQMPLALLINFGSTAKLEWHRFAGIPIP